MTSLLIRLFVKNSKDTKSQKVRTAYGNLGSAVGILANIILSFAKILIGAFSGILSITADGLNNFADIGSSVLTFIGFKLSNKPADRDHPFGHGRMEYMAAFTVSFLILLVGFELLGDSVNMLIEGTPAPRFTLLSIVALIISIIVKLWLYFFNKKIGKAIDSSALAATAQDSLNDCISTGAILVVAAVTYFAELPFNLDAVAAIGVALFIIWSGISSAKDTLNEILGAPPEKELIDNLSATVLSFECFVGIHDLIVHNYGPNRQFASVHVEVPQTADVVSVHEKVDLCEKLIYERFGVNLVIHTDPIDTDNEAVNAARENMVKALKAIDKRLTLHDFRMTPAAETRTNLIFDVVVPSGFEYTEKELDKIINAAAKGIDSTYVCVITFDNDFTGEQIH